MSEYKYLSPYYEVNDDFYYKYTRYFLGTKISAFYVKRNMWGTWDHSVWEIYPDDNRSYSGPEEAMEYLDGRLLQLGYYLVPKDKEDKLLLLI